MVLQLLSHEQLFATLCTAAHQASLSFTVSRSLLKLMSVELLMLSDHLILFSYENKGQILTNYLIPALSSLSTL